MNAETKDRPHWSFWIIGIIGLIWHLMGSMNFVMQMNPTAVADMPEEYRAVIESRPVWASAAFAVAVFGGAIGSVLLLLRKSAATILFIASLLGVLVQTIPFLEGPGVGSSVWIGSLISLVVAVFLIWYSRHVKI